MSRNKDKNESLYPTGFLFRLTFINIIVITFFILMSSWAIYNTACVLADGLVTMNSQRQSQFESTLFQYLWIFSISAIVIGSLVHFYLTNKVIHPLRALITSTKEMKQGRYPNPILVKSKDEIGELSNHFNDLVQQLKNTEELRQKFITDLSHEVRTPLANLNGYLLALKNGVIPGDEKLYQSLYEELKRLITLVEQMDQLKEWDYISKQAFSEKERENMQLLVEQSVNMFRWALHKAGMTVNVEAEPGEVNVNNGAILQVISNLIENAIRYYEGTGPITIKGVKRESEYKLSVSGEGQMIPDAARERIFERFYQIEQPHTTDSEGTGLGLAISKEIIEHHHGKIGLHSKGSNHTFWFTLPLDEWDRLGDC